jgi:DNA-binding transcriptional MerR regulator
MAMLSPLDLIKAKYRTFLSVPKRYRPEGLKTAKEFADRFGVPAGTLLHWEQEPGFVDDIFAESRAIITRNMADILQSLVDRATTGSITAIKLALEVLGVHHDKVEVQHTRHQDQIILVLPEGMSLPAIGNVGDDTVEGEYEEVKHLDEDMNFVLNDGTPQPSAHLPGAADKNSGTHTDSDMDFVLNDTPTAPQVHEWQPAGEEFVLDD